MKLRYELLIFFLIGILLGSCVLCVIGSVRVKAFSYQGDLPAPISQVAQVLMAANLSFTLQNFSSIITMENDTYDVHLEYADVLIESYETVAFLDLHIRNLSIRGAVNLAFSKLDLYIMLFYGQDGGEFYLTAYTEIPLWEFIVSQKLTQKVKKLGGML